MLYFVFVLLRQCFRIVNIILLSTFVFQSDDHPMTFSPVKDTHTRMDMDLWRIWAGWWLQLHSNIQSKVTLADDLPLDESSHYLPLDERDACIDFIYDVDTCMLVLNEELDPWVASEHWQLRTRRFYCVCVEPKQLLQLPFPSLHSFSVIITFCRYWSLTKLVGTPSTIWKKLYRPVKKVFWPWKTDKFDT